MQFVREISPIDIVIDSVFNSLVSRKIQNIYYCKSQSFIPFGTIIWKENEKYQGIVVRNNSITFQKRIKSKYLVKKNISILHSNFEALNNLKFQKGFISHDFKISLCYAVYDSTKCYNGYASELIINISTPSSKIFSYFSKLNMRSFK